MLINQLMDFRKIENQKMTLQASERDLISFVKGVADAFSRLALMKQISFTVEADIKELRLYFDADKLDKVLFNLLSNAFKFTQDTGSIKLKTELSDDYRRLD